MVLSTHYAFFSLGSRFVLFFSLFFFKKPKQSRMPKEATRQRLVESSKTASSEVRLPEKSGSKDTAPASSLNLQKPCSSSKKAESAKEASPYKRAVLAASSEATFIFKRFKRSVRTVSSRGKFSFNTDKSVVSCFKGESEGEGAFGFFTSSFFVFCFL